VVHNLDARHSHRGHTKLGAHFHQSRVLRPWLSRFERWTPRPSVAWRRHCCANGPLPRGTIFPQSRHLCLIWAGRRRIWRRERVEMGWSRLVGCWLRRKWGAARDEEKIERDGGHHYWWWQWGSRRWRDRLLNQARRQSWYSWSESRREGGEKGVEGRMEGIRRAGESRLKRASVCLAQWLSVLRPDDALASARHGNSHKDMRHSTWFVAQAT
jgi:hypothetical protein